MSILLKTGDHSSNVAYWQGFLVGYGFSDVLPDAHFGAKTALATRSFQAANGLRADGIVGQNTIKAAKAFGFKGFPNDEDHIPDDRKKVVLVSAGHTNIKGKDRGAAAGGYIEGELAVTLRDAVADKLRRKGLTVTEDGSDGENEPLTRALELARKADIAVEFHWNAAASIAATGIEVLSKPKHKAFAQKLAGAIHEATGLKLRGESGWKADNSGQHHRLAFCEADGLIVEVCFITNKNDMNAYHGNYGKVVEKLADVLG